MGNVDFEITLRNSGVALRLDMIDDTGDHTSHVGDAPIDISVPAHGSKTVVADSDFDGSKSLARCEIRVIGGGGSGSPKAIQLRRD